MGKIRIFQRIKPAGEDGFCRGIGSGAARDRERKGNREPEKGPEKDEKR